MYVLKAYDEGKLVVTTEKLYTEREAEMALLELGAASPYTWEMERV